MRLPRLVLLLAASAIASCAALQFTLNSGQEMSFHEQVHKGIRVTAFYEVMPFRYYVNMRVLSPSGKETVAHRSQSEGSVDFVAEEEGEYRFVFKAPHGKARDVTFTTNIEDILGHSEAVKEDHVNELNAVMQRLQSQVGSARVTLDTFRMREARHRQTALRNRRRVTIWASVECLLIVAVAAAQIFRVRNFLENKRNV